VRLLVVGGGAAGTAAAWVAARMGVDVHLLHGRAGATEMFSGALDESEARSGREPAKPSGEVREFLEALGGVWVAREDSRVCTRLGVIRPVGAAQAPLLDLGRLAGGHVGVAAVPREGWDAELLAEGFADSDWARRTSTRFSAVSLPLVQHPSELRISSYDFARKLDSPDRLARLEHALASTASQFDGWLFGPWLGVETDVAERLRESLGRPLGETTSPPEGPAGARFAIARDRLLQRMGVTVHPREARALDVRDSGWVVELGPVSSASAGLGPEQMCFDAVVLAVGGLASGGIELWHPDPPQPDVALSVRAPVRFAADGVSLDGPSGLFGIDWQRWGAEALERIGVVTDQASVPEAQALFAAGSLLSDRPRTMLEAIRSGIEAGVRTAG